MSENVIPISFRIQCRDCKHPGKYHDMKGCIFRDCNCKRLEPEELEHSHAIDSLSGKAICWNCSTLDGPFKDGVCTRCKRFLKIYKHLEEKHPKWNGKQLRDNTNKIINKEDKIDAKKES